jgi:hypothetical protein
MTFDEIYDNTISGKYETKLKYPPYRGELKEKLKYKSKDSLDKVAYNEDQANLDGIFRDDLRLYVEAELGQKITDLQFEFIYEMAWEKGHASGYHEVVLECSDLLVVIMPFLESG